MKSCESVVAIIVWRMWMEIQTDARCLALVDAVDGVVLNLCKCASCSCKEDECRKAFGLSPDCQGCNHSGLGTCKPTVPIRRVKIKAWPC